MNSNDPHCSRPNWTKSPYAFGLFSLLSLITGWLTLRAVLWLVFKRHAASGDIALLFLNGLHRDLLVGLVFLLPFLLWCLLIPQRSWSRRWHRSLFWTVATAFCFACTFLLFVEYFFFDEFTSRFNTVAVDYLLYPQEVFINIWQSYHVGIVLLVCATITAGWVLGARKFFPEMWQTPVARGARVAWLAGALVLTSLLALTVRFKGVEISHDRAVNELANNGGISFVEAAWSRHLDYGAFYRTMDKGEAYQRARRLLTEPNTSFLEPGESIRRAVAGDPNRPKLNVVVILEESLGSEFWGCLGRRETLTPEMDKLATEEGMLFTSLYASGNRTVRGMEGVLSSFPPLPGDSIVKRDRSDNVETLARVLKRDGYDTMFLYGGRGVFDGMRSYAVRNGYDRFVEQKHFAKPTFTTIWGVCDEDLFSRSIEEMRALSATGKPFFATLLTVSNHRPYTYPKGRIPENPDRKWRKYAVKYADYSLGQFFRAAKQEPFWTNTVFAVIADHGARVYGKESIPIHSYEIPLVILGPAVVKAPIKIPQLGCSLDVGPTLLGLVGRPYDSLFFGRDMLKMQPSDGRVILNHNRDIGMMAQERMVVLGLMQTVEFYAGNPKQRELTPLPGPPTPAETELERDAVALYQFADDLYMSGRYGLDTPQPPGGHSAGSRSLQASQH